MMTHKSGLLAGSWKHGSCINMLLCGYFTWRTTIMWKKILKTISFYYSFRHLPSPNWRPHHVYLHEKGIPREQGFRFHAGLPRLRNWRLDLHNRCSELEPKSVETIVLCGQISPDINEWQMISVFSYKRDLDSCMQFWGGLMTDPLQNWT